MPTVHLDISAFYDRGNLIQTAFRMGSSDNDQHLKLNSDQQYHFTIQLDLLTAAVVTSLHQMYPDQVTRENALAIFKQHLDDRFSSLEQTFSFSTPKDPNEN